MKKQVGSILYIFAGVFTIYNVYIEQISMYKVDIISKMCNAVIIIAAFIIPTIYMIRTNPNKKQIFLKIFVYIMFVYYIWILSNMLLFDSTFGRLDMISSDESIYTRINLKPFFTIKNYIYTYLHGNISSNIVAINIIGNVFAFAPFGVFFPILFKKMRNFFMFFFTMLFIICSVEILQMFSRAGSCDVDDLILNMFGALVLFMFMQLPPLKKLRI